MELPPRIAKIVPACLMCVITLLHLGTSANRKLSSEVLAGQSFGTTLLPTDRDVVRSIEGSPFGKSRVGNKSVESLWYDVALARVKPDKKQLQKIADMLLASRWRDSSKEMELLWGKEFPPAAPTRVEPWHVEPVAGSLVDVEAVDVAVFQYRYDPETATLNADLLEKSRSDGPGQGGAVSP